MLTATAITPVPADPSALYRSAIADLEAPWRTIHPPTCASMPAPASVASRSAHRARRACPAEITLEGNLPAMLSRAGIETWPKPGTGAAIAFERLVECSIKRDPAARALAGRRAAPRFLGRRACSSGTGIPGLGAKQRPGCIGHHGAAEHDVFV